MAAGSRTGAAIARGLVLACHPGPTVAVTTFVTAVAVAAGNGFVDCLLVFLAVLTGQLSIGWSNDWIDSARDRAVARSDKPVATGALPVEVVRAAAWIAAAACVPASFALGWWAGSASLLATAAGWAYNIRLKGTVLSWLPYAVAFGVLPAVATLPLPGTPWPHVWAMAAGALLGTGAHLANVLPDFDDDRHTGIRGFPHRIGRRATTFAAPVPLLAATLLVVLGPEGAPAALQWLGLAAAVGLSGVAIGVAVRSVRSRLPFLLVIGVAAVDVALLIAAGSSIV